MQYFHPRSSNSIQLTVQLHETSAHNTGLNTGHHCCGYAVSATLLSLGSAWHWCEAGFWRGKKI